MYSSGSKRRRIKPYARPTSFDYNVRFDVRHYQDVKYNRIKDPYFHAASNDECFRVMEGELLAKDDSQGSRYNDKELHVFSFANGLSAPSTAPISVANQEFKETTSNSASEQRLVRRAILKNIQYMGVAVTEFSPSRDVYEQGFVATIAGLNTLYNNGSDVIYPGQTVCMDLPELRQTGRGNRYKRSLQQGLPREKLQFIVRPRTNMLQDYGDSELVNKFIIGTAISYSRQGDTVDVILHRMNYTSESVQPSVRSAVQSGSSLLGLSKLVNEGEKDKVQAGLDDILKSLDAVGNPEIVTDYLQASGETQLDAVADKILKEEIKLRRQYALQEKTAVGAESGIGNVATLDKAFTDLENGYDDNNAAQKKVVIDGVNGVLEAKILGDGSTGKLTGVAKQLMESIKSKNAIKHLTAIAAGLAASIATKNSSLGDHPLSWSDKNAVTNLNRVLGGDEVPHMHGSSSGPSISAAVGVKKKRGKK